MFINEQMNKSNKYQDRPIYLVGFMGSGKSTIGQKLADSLKLDFVDTDEMIEARTDSSIASLFEKYGEQHFRELELIILKELVFSKEIIISTGGGLPIYNRNMDLINNTGVSIYLKTKQKILIQRLKAQYQIRPLLPEEEIEKTVNDLLGNREKIYENSKIIIENDGTIQESISAILNELTP